MNHLTDQEIQAFADKTSSHPEVEAHLQSCKLCQSHAAAYRLVFSELNKDSDFALSRNFAQSVITRIEEKQEQASLWRDWILIGLLGIAGVAISIYYAGSSLTGDVVTDFVKDTFKSREAVTSSFRQVENWFSGGWSYLIYGSFLLLIFNWLDEKLVKSNRFSGQH